MIGLDFFLEVHVVGLETRVELLDHRHVRAQRPFVAAALHRAGQDVREQLQTLDHRSGPAAQRRPGLDHERADHAAAGRCGHDEHGAVTGAVGVLSSGDGLARQLVGPRDRQQLAVAGPIDQPRFRGDIVRDVGDGLAGRRVRVRQRAGIAELEQPAPLGADRRPHLLERRADRGGQAIERDARQLPRQGEGKLCQVFLIDHRWPHGRNIDDCHDYLTSKIRERLWGE